MFATKLKGVHSYPGGDQQAAKLHWEISAYWWLLNQNQVTFLQVKPNSTVHLGGEKTGGIGPAVRQSSLLEDVVCCRQLLWVSAWISLPHFSRFSPSSCFLADTHWAERSTAKQSSQRGVSLGRHLTLCSITCILHDSIIIQLCLGRIIVVTAHIKAPNLIQLEHLEIKLRCSRVQVIFLFLP